MYNEWLYVVLISSVWLFPLLNATCTSLSWLVLYGTATWWCF